MFVRINYDDESSMLIEGLGPNAIVGCVADFVHEHYKTGPGGKKVKSILVEHKPELTPDMKAWR